MLELEALVGEDWREVAEVGATPGVLGRTPVDGIELLEGREIGRAHV